MIQSLLSHEWKKSTRSPRWGKALATKIFLGFISIYLLLNFLVLGIALHQILTQTVPEQPSYVWVNQFILYYLLGDVLFRFLLQDIPTAGLVAYLHLPISKRRLLHFQLLRSHLNIFNLLPLLIIVPFALIGIFPELGSAATGSWLLGIFALIWFNHHVAFRLKTAFSAKPAIVFGVLILLIGIGYLDYMNYLPLSEYMLLFFNALFEHYWLPVALLILPIAAYAINWQILWKNAYLDSDASQRAISSKTVQSSGKNALVDLLSKIGLDSLTAEMLQMEWRLIRRNKRPWQTFLLSLFFLLYGLLTFNSMDMQWFQLFVAVFLTGIFAINHGQFTLSWEGSYFDYLLTRQFSMERFFVLKYRIFAISNLLYFLVSLLYLFLIPGFFPYVLTAFLFNLGVSSLLVIGISTYNSTPIDLGRSSFMNYQGVQATQFIFAILVIGLPQLIYILCSKYTEEWIGLLLISGMGILGFIFHQPIIKHIARKFQTRRYRTAEKMRQ